MLRLADLFLALIDLEDSLLQLRLQLRHFEHGECLTLVHDVADIDVDLPHVAADLGVYVHHLVGLKLPGQGEHVGEIAALGGRYPGGGHRRSLGIAGFVRRAARAKSKRRQCRCADRCEQNRRRGRVAGRGR